MLKVKVCGINVSENLTKVSELRPDFIGMNFYPKSKRFVDNGLTTENLKNIRLTGVFVDEQLPVILQKADQYGLTYIQLHGNETPELCEQIRNEGLKTIKVFRITDEFDFSDIEPFLEFTDFLLFDTMSQNFGGSGKVFNWHVLKYYPFSKPFFLAGGLSPGNIHEVLKLELPKLYGVDINSGYEVSPGIKDIEKVKELIHLLRS